MARTSWVGSPALVQREQLSSRSIIIRLILDPPCPLTSSIHLAHTQTHPSLTRARSIKRV